MAATMVVGADIAVVIAGTASMAMVAETTDTGTIAVMAAGVVAGVVAAEDMVITNWST